MVLCLTPQLKTKLSRAGLQVEDSSFGPIGVCIGESRILKALENVLKDKGVGEYSIKLSPEEGFGKRDTKLIRFIPPKYFKEKKLNPYPGLSITVDDDYGVVRSVSGGRILVDFNHPWSGKDLFYEVKVHEKIEDSLEKAKALFSNDFGKHSLTLRTGQRSVTDN